VLEQAAPDRRRLLLVRAVEQEAELVAAEARDRVARAEGLLEPACDGGQKLVARIVSEAVVHPLEAIEVDDEHAERRPRARRVRDRLVEPVAEERPVRHPREAVVVGLMRQLLLEPHSLRDVAGIHHHSANAPVLAEIRDMGLEMAPLLELVGHPEDQLRGPGAGPGHAHGREIVGMDEARVLVAQHRVRIHADHRRD
jgi:hypothetical protein